MTIAEIKMDYVQHKCTYFETVNRLMEHIDMPERLAKQWVDGWFDDWWATPMTRSST